VATAGIFEGQIILDCSYSQRDLALQIPGSRWLKDKQLWAMPLTWASCLQLRGLYRDSLEITDELQKWAWDLRETRIEPALALRDMLEPESNDETSALFHVKHHLEALEQGELRLKPFQVVDAAFLITCGQAGLFSQPGSGKSPVTIRALQILNRMGLDPFPALIVCPNSLKNTVWAQELERWAPELTVSVVSGNATVRRKQIMQGADVTVINYESLRLHTHEAGYGTIRLSEKQRARKELNAVGYRTVICDEAHRLRHADTAMTRSAWAVLHEAEFRYLLTGTPVNDHCGDLWGLLHGILPDWHPRYTRYISRYAEVGYNWFGGTQILGLRPDTAREFRKITEPVYRRMLKEAILPQLPPKLPPQVRETPMTPKQAKAYKSMEENLLTIVDSGEVLAAPSSLAQMTRLLQFASATADVDEKGEVQLKDPSGKVDDLVEFLEEIGEDEPLVVAAVSRKLIELAAARLKARDIRYGLVTGAQTTVQRSTAVQHFQEGRSRVILLTLGAGAEGITLTRANTILFMQKSWSPDINEQMTDRVHRIGSEHHAAIRIIEQVTPGTIESRVREILEGKQWRIEEVLSDREMLRRMLGRV
jgi:SNF2 family DNA or RNA helicase